MPTLALGHDMRLCADAYLPGFWARDRRDHFLLRPDVEWPLSFDPMVWPSIFDSPDEVRVPGLKDWWPERPPTIVAEPAEKRYDAFMDLWPSLEEMLAVFRKRAKPGACGVPIAVEMVGDVTPESDIAPWPDFDTEVPVQSRPDDWVFLGYDICDFGWISGLSNCGGSGEEMRRLRAAWQDRLNAFGLFESRADAAAYRAASDQRVAEHAPFRIFALYRAPRAERR